MGVREATIDDLDAMLVMTHKRRSALAAAQPVMWRAAPNADVMSRLFFEALIGQPEAITLVYEGREGIDGFVIALEQQSPPVYQPGGKTFLIDDFVVTETDVAADIAAALLEQAEGRAKALGGCQMIAVAPVCEPAKSNWLAARTYSSTTHWMRRDI